jgi:hypothetical protein
VCITGDFNLPDVDWDYYHGPDNFIYNSVLHFFNSYGFTQCVNDSTRGSNILDLVLVDSHCAISNVTILPPIGTSDHSVVLFKLNVNSENNDCEQQAYPDFAKADYVSLNSYLWSVNWDGIFQQCFDVNNCWLALLNLINEAVQLFVPLGHVRKMNRKPLKHYPRYIKKLLKQKAILWKRWKLTSFECDKSNYKFAAQQSSDAIKKYNANKELELVRKNNLGSFYKFVGNKLNTHSTIKEILKPDGTFSSSEYDIAETLNNFFGSVFTADDGSAPKMDDNVNPSSAVIDSVVFTPMIVNKALKKLKPSTSTGPDGLPNILLRNCCDSLAMPLCHIFDISFKDSKLPSSWKVASVLPIHKKGSTSDPNNYRPISLTATCCRVMERILNENLLNYLLTNKLITKQQHGFICSKSTSTNLLECVYDWSLNMQNHAGTDIIYFDFKKAFDSVSHPKLLTKLRAYGISGLLLAWINDFLQNRSQFVALRNYQSEPIPVISGVPQGSVLGPTLFLLYINDVGAIFQNLAVTCKLYADDIKLYSCYTTTDCEYIQDLSDAIERLFNWSRTWQLHLATNKCFMCEVKNSKIYPNTHVYMMDNHCLSCVDSVRDLGVIIDNRLKFDKHISLITRKALLRSRLILKCFNSRDRSLLVKAYCTYVRPLLEYCNVVWSPHHQYLIDKIEGVQRFFTKRLDGLRNVPYCIRLALLQLESLEYRRLVCDLVFCYKVQHKLVDTELCNALTRSIYTTTRGHPFKLQKIPCSCDATKYFFTNRLHDLWNELPDSVVAAESANSFKQRLHNLNLSAYLRFPCFHFT